MSQYKVYFDSYDSITTFGLILTDVQISSPEPKRDLVDVPGRDGQLDLSIQPIRFKNRQLVMTFVLKSSVTTWDTTRSNLFNLLHGKYMDIVLETDPNWYWHGLVTVNDADINIHKGEFKIVVDGEPFKYKDISLQIDSSDVPIMYYLPNKAGTIVPKITTDANLVVYGKNLVPYPYADGSSFTYRGVTYTVDDGVITANGTANNTSYYALFKTGIMPTLIAGEQYTLSLEVENGKASVFFAHYDSNNSNLGEYTLVDVNNTLREVNFTAWTDTYARNGLGIYIKNNVSCTNTKIKVMIRLASATNAETGAAYTGTTSDYEPYTTYSFDAGTTSATDMEFGSEGKFITLLSASDVTIDYSEESL